MLSIGEFSKICGVTTRTLRHYDDINLIKPKRINEENGYRFYDISQIRKMLLINRLKEYDFSLEEIASIMKKNNDKYTLQKITEKLDYINEKISQYENMEKSIKEDITNLRNGVDIMAFIENISVELVIKEDQIILSSRQRMSTEDYGKYIGRLFEIVSKEKIKVIGAPISIYHDTEFNHLDNDTEVAIPVLEECENTRILKGGLCAKGVCKGAYSNLNNVYGKLMEWIDKNNYKLIDAPYEQYIKGFTTTNNIDEFITEVYFPIKKIK